MTPEGHKTYIGRTEIAWWRYNRYAPHNDISVNDGPYIQRWSQKIM